MSDKPENIIYFEPEKHTLDEMGLGECLAANLENKFVRLFGGAKQTGLWANWDGSKWVRDKSNLLERYSTNILRELKKRNPYVLPLSKMRDELGHAVQPGKRKNELIAVDGSKETEARIKEMQILEYNCEQFNKLMDKSMTMSGRIRIIDRASELINIAIEGFDANDFLMATRNKTIDLGTGKITSHKPENYITKTMNVEYDKDVTLPRWEQFVDEIMGSNEEAKRYLQKVIGYSFSGENNLKKMFMLYGSGDSGKTLFLQSIRNVLGSYATTGVVSLIANKKESTPEQRAMALANFHGSRMVVFEEPKLGSMFDDQLLKEWTGRSEVTARKLFEMPFEYVPQFTMFVISNNLPKVSDNVLFRTQRMNLIVFPRSFSKEEQDTTLDKQFGTEQAKTAILNWILDGYKMFKEEGLGETPDMFKQANAEYEEESDPLNEFLREVVVEDKLETVKWKDVYETYKTWCQEQGMYFKKKLTLKKELEAKGIVIKSSTLHANQMIMFGYRFYTDSHIGDDPIGF